MLDQLEEDRAGDMELIWPTAYAAPVLRGAVAAAEAAVSAVASHASARAALESAKTTLSDFLAVDNGGLAEVNL